MDSEKRTTMRMDRIMIQLYHKKEVGELVEVLEGCEKEVVEWIPTLAYIACTSSPSLHKYLLSLALKSIPLYLAVRWSYASYCPTLQQLLAHLNKVDATFINQLTNSSNIQHLNEHQIAQLITRKEIMSGYVYVLNSFYDDLFQIPYRLLNVPEEQRQKQLGGNLEGIFGEFRAQQDTLYCSGVCMPLFNDCNEGSYLVVGFVRESCLPFATKDKIPFKFVFETINFHDYDQHQLGQKQENKQPTEPAQHNKQQEHPQQPTQKQKQFRQEQQTNSLLLPHSYFSDGCKQRQRMREQSVYGNLSSYMVHGYIVKSGDDVRQEHMAMQLIRMMAGIIRDEHLQLWVRPYRIIPFNKQCGLIEFVEGTKTISALKETSNQKSLRTIYKQIFGSRWETAITNFVRSLAGYSLFQYLFQLKDRHNKNILIDSWGHMIHIDFTYMLSSSPGNINFEKSPFKLNWDYVEMMEGKNSELFEHFKFLLFIGLKYLRKYKEQIIGYLIIMSQHSQMKCFANFDKTKIQQRFHTLANDNQLKTIVDNLVSNALNSSTTANYDRYQYYTNLIIA